MKSKSVADALSHTWQSDEKHEGQIEYHLPLLDSKVYLDQRTQNGATTGTSLWLCAEVLSCYLQCTAKYARTGTAVDLGAGTGLVSLVLERLGWTKVIATDIDPCLSTVLRSNIQRNQKGSIAVRQLDWNAFNPSDAFLEAGDIDLIVSADTVYEQSLIDGLWRTIRLLLTADRRGHASSKQSHALVAIERRDDTFVNQAIALAQQQYGLSMKSIPKHHIRKAISRTFDLSNEAVQDAIERIEIWQVSVRRDDSKKD